MGAKKKAEGGSSPTKGGQPDDSGDRLYRACRRNMVEYGVSMPKKLEEKFLTIRDEKNPGFLREIVLWDNIGIMAIRALADALRDTQYQHVQAIQCWKAGIEDEGVRSITQFIRVCPTVCTMEFMDCGLTALSCEFIGSTLLLKPDNPLSILKLDHNCISDSGVTNLANAFRMNPIIRVISLSYCNITESSGRALMEIIIFQESALEELELRGNLIRNSGVVNILFGCRINKSLTYLGLADNEISDEGNVPEELIEMLKVNDTLAKLDLRYNRMRDECYRFIIGKYKTPTGNINKTLEELMLPDGGIRADLIEELKALLSAGGGGKGKKGKKKGKRKGKKK